MITPELLDKLTEVANAEYRTDEIEVDRLRGEQDLSISAEGTWVRAWVFLSKDFLQAHGLKDFALDDCV